LNWQMKIISWRKWGDLFFFLYVKISFALVDWDYDAKNKSSRILCWICAYAKYSKQLPASTKGILATCYY
jgi:hypothetical protein